MPIEDFIFFHGPAELEKLECRDPLNKQLAPADSALGGDTLSVNMSVNNKSNMRRLDSKSTVRSSATKTPLKKRGN